MKKSAARGGETSFATPRRAFFIFSHAVLRAEPQLTERLKEVNLSPIWSDGLILTGIEMNHSWAPAAWRTTKRSTCFFEVDP